MSIAEGGYLLEADPDTVVAPDIGFVARKHLLDPIPERGFLPVVPDLAVEVISPSDERADIERKQALYERVGVPLVWWIDPCKQSATAHRPGQPAQHLDRTGHLDGGDVLPGFSLALSDIFDQD